jgi:hypothetical protein
MGNKMNTNIIPPISNPIIPYVSNYKSLPKANFAAQAQDVNTKTDSLKNIPTDLYRAIESELAETLPISNPDTIANIAEMISDGKARIQQFVAKDQLTFAMFKMPDGVLYTRITDHTSGAVCYYPALDTASFERAMKPFSNNLV